MDWNLQKQLGDYLQCWPWKYRSRSLSTSFAIVSFDGKYQNLWRSYFIRASSHSIRNINIWNIYLEKVGQSNAVLISKWRHSMAKTSIPTKAMLHFLRASFDIFRDINIWNIWPLKGRSRSLNTTFAVALIDDKHQQVMLHMLVLSLTVFVILTFWISLVYLEKVGHVHKILLLQWRHSIENIQIYKSLIKHFVS